MKQSPKSRAAIASVAAGLIALATVPATALAQVGHPTMAGAANAQVPVQRVLLAQGKSAIIDLPADARDVVVANPDVADAVMRTTRRGFLLGQKNGETNVYFLDAQGRQILVLEVRVARDTSELDSLISRLAPDARVQAEAVGDSVILSGEVLNAAAADRVLRIASNYAGGADKIVNLMSIKTGDQVQLRVRIVEMQRSVIKQLGVNLSATNILNQLLPEDWGVRFATANGYAVNGSFLGGSSVDATWAQNFVRPVTNTFKSGQSALLNPAVGAGAGGFSDIFDPSTGVRKITYGPGELVSNQRADTNVQALERVGLARTLAEPTLTATSGQSSNFLAGGEFPVPVAQDGRAVSISFKPFGVGLSFTPTVLSADRISLKVSTEVSEISTAVSYRQNDTLVRDAAGNVVEIIRGLQIPGVTTRRAESTMELPSGRSMVMAGLIQQSTRQSVEGLPGLKDLPILGNLFRSRDFISNDTELVIIITPYLVNSTTMDQLQTPADGYAPATDAEALILGRLNRVVRPRSTSMPQGRYRAPVGHVLN